MRSATAGGDSPTRRPSSARLSRASIAQLHEDRDVRLVESLWIEVSLSLSAFGSFAVYAGILRVGLPSLSAPNDHKHHDGALDPGGSPVLTPRVPPQAYFVGSAVFHYLGPAFAVLLFARVDVLGVAWLRIASAALVFALWRRPWRRWAPWIQRARQTPSCSVWCSG